MKKLSLLALLALPLMFLTACNTRPTTDVDTSAMDSFAECLTTNGVKMYGTATCPHCKQQKAMFGPSFEKIDYIDCAETPEVCTEAGIQGVPTWEYPDGTFKQGVQELKILGQSIGCEAPEEG